MRKPLIAGNWKMFKTGSEAIETAGKLKQLVGQTDHADIMIAPPYTALAQVHGIIADSPIELGSQNLFWEKEGAYTGEISPAMLVAAGCLYVIIGHSERRQYFGETNQNVNKKIAAALANNLIPVLCIGESEEEREANQTFSILDKQLEEGLQGFSSTDLEKLVIAYEPVWAIGTGKTATNEQAQEVHLYVRSEIEKRFENILAKTIRILYGGSVKSDNIKALMAMPDIDGALVGGASLNAESFSRIIKYPEQ